MKISAGMGFRAGNDSSEVGRAVLQLLRPARHRAAHHWAQLEKDHPERLLELQQNPGPRGRGQLLGLAESDGQLGLRGGKLPREDSEELPVSDHKILEISIFLRNEQLLNIFRDKCRIVKIST